MKKLIFKVSKHAQMNEYYSCEDMARSYRDFGVPYNLAKEWVRSKVNASAEVVERACNNVYYPSND